MVNHEIKKTKIWKIIAIIEMLILIAAISAAFIVYKKMDSDSKETFNDLENTNDSSSDGYMGENTSELIKTVKLTEDLWDKINDINTTLSGNDDKHDFTASVKELYGFEYLCFSIGEMDIYYRNEFLLEEDNRRDKIIIDNGRRRAEYDWDYTLEANLEDLCPNMIYNDETKNTSLLFAVKEYNTAEIYSDINSSDLKELRLIDKETLWEYEVFDVNKAFTALFTLDYAKAASESEDEVQNNDKYLLMNITNIEYKYLISQDTYDALSLDKTTPQNTSKRIDITIKDGSISLLSIIAISSDEYLGQLTLDLVFDGLAYSLKNIRYGAYADANVEDIDLNGIITPYKEVPKDYVTIHGNKGERFIIEKSSILKRFDYELDAIKTDENGIKTYFADGVLASHIGIDVSKYQGNIDWKKVAAAGVEFAFVRLGFRGMNRGEGNGNLSYDEYYENNIKGAIDAGIETGVYFFSQAITIEEAVEEAEMVIEALKGYDITYPVVFDTEAVYINGYSARANDLTRQQRTDIVKAFCETIKNAGYQPMIYANTKWMIMGIDLEQLDEYKRWFAYYGNNFIFPYDIHIWQYSDAGKIPGISGNVDLNIGFIDLTK